MSEKKSDSVLYLNTNNLTEEEYIKFIDNLTTFGSVVISPPSPDSLKIRVQDDQLLENALNCLSLFDITKLTVADAKRAISWLEDWIDAKQSAECKIKFPAYEIGETEIECEACKIQFSKESENTHSPEYYGYSNENAEALKQIVERFRSDENE